MSNTYAISIERFRAKLVLNGVGGDEDIDIEPGMTLQIVEKVSAKIALIQVKDFHHDLQGGTGGSRSSGDERYQCNASSLQQIPSDVWPFVIAILDPHERHQFAMRPKLFDAIKSLKPSDMVLVSGLAFNRDVMYDCIIRHIGLVSEIGPGYYFGLELLNLNQGESPQKDDLSFVRNYMNCEPRLAFILAANWLKFPDIDHSTKLHPKRNLFDVVLCGAKDINQRLTRRTAKRLSDEQKSFSASGTGSSGSSDHQLPYNRSCTPDLTGGYNRKSTDITALFDTMDTKQQKKIAASISSPNLSKQDSSSSTGSSGRFGHSHPMDNYSDECHRYGDNNQQQLLLDELHRSGRSSQNSSNNSTLKHSKARKNKAGTASKQSTILSLADRDVVVIDSNEIDEATKCASDVIIVQPPATLSPTENLVDLNDLLGNNWPSTAGAVATILNSDKKTQTPTVAAYSNGTISSGTGGGGYSSSSSNSTNGLSGSYHNRHERNKSLNPLAHLGGVKSSEQQIQRRHREQKLTADASTMAKLSDGHIPTVATAILPNDNTTGLPHTTIPSSSESDGVQHESPMQQLPNDPTLDVGSMVEITVDESNEQQYYGVIRWIGPLQCNGNHNRTIMVGIELEDESNLEATNGCYNGVRLFKCPPNRAIFVKPNQCSKDRRFQDVPQTPPSTSKAPPASNKSDASMFGKVDCPVVKGAVPPLKILKLEELKAICGNFKGIQGHHNSCYLDATLFAMFTFTSVFDSLLFRPKEPEDNPQYEEVQRVLLEEIVNPLRKNHFVRADRVMKLRELLDRLSSVTGLLTEEKDPEEFLNSLLAQILRADPFLKLSSGLDTFYYQLFVEKDERLNLPSVQQLFEQSFHTSNIKLKEVPSCLIIQMPRFGKNYKMYPRILPSNVLDVTDIIDDSPRQCTVCGMLAEYECRECFSKPQSDGLEETAFCKGCLDAAHRHAKRYNHKSVPLSVPNDFKAMAMNTRIEIPRLFMELFAVVCIETSHYVAFVKAASGQDAPWCFFDSMADRNGEQNGYNIPKMVPVPDLPRWLSEEGALSLNDEAVNDKMLPEHAKRLLCDAYMCMYQSTDMMMYR